MAKTRQKKQQEVELLQEKLKQAKGIVFSCYQGLSVQQTEELRQALREHQAELKMTKKSLLKIALEKSGIDGVEPKEMDGSLSLALGYQDEVSAAKTLAEFAKANADNLQIVGGVLEGRFISRDKVIALAKLPSKQELLAKTVGTINAPVASMVRVLAANLNRLVYVLQAVKETKS